MVEKVSFEILIWDYDYNMIPNMIEDIPSSFIEYYIQLPLRQFSRLFIKKQSLKFLLKLL